MRYIDFKDAILAELRRCPTGLSWSELRERLALPYERPCQEWVRRLEAETGLRRERGSTPAFVWKLPPAEK